MLQRLTTYALWIATAAQTTPEPTGTAGGWPRSNAPECGMQSLEIVLTLRPAPWPRMGRAAERLPKSLWSHFLMILLDSF
jgi:hypothetical protein